jgi:hypothetical protein
MLRTADAARRVRRRKRRILLGRRETVASALVRISFVHTEKCASYLSKIFTR